ncbi:hypothetical protein CANARDRAFT_7456 [[Candida] arabinofermentans NRRL YB-2248]|uniref:Efficient mitochondria targeting-associated protein 19 n=1 Tax=[Candida] arabinofermentans NRRL YB-2248 TaxID=983967 RepID=A0A1E4T2V9_9ASCO|nr:hypothetical protein CANARDRAFT_7456 [[Candida] arabinofermentans NRRL YB-2248]
MGSITDNVYFYYFLIHIPITLLMDSNYAIPENYRLTIQQKLYEFHINKNKDFLGLNVELWMKSFVLFELIFQLPIFIYAIYDYYFKNDKIGYSKKLWPILSIYGFNASFTTLICIIYIIFKSEENGIVGFEFEFWNLLGLYTPTFILPAYMMFDFMNRCMRELNDTKVKDQ